MSPTGSVITLFLLFTFALAIDRGEEEPLVQEKKLEQNARCGASYTEEWKNALISVNEDVDCTWAIERPSNDTIRLIFSLITLNPNANCSEEYVEVTDVYQQVMGKLCADSPQVAVFESTGNVNIRVATNSEAFSRSIYFMYYSLNLQDAVPCGGNIQDYSGTLSSPNYPNRHSPFSYCSWTVELPKNTKAKLSFSEIFVEIDPACRFDFIAVYDGPSVDAPLLNVLCGRTTAELETTSNAFTLVFSADYANSYFGFSVDFSAVPKSSHSSLACSGSNMTVVLDNGYISSLGYNAEDLTLIDKSCGPVSANPIVFDVPYIGCGTVKKTEDQTISYTNTIQASPDSGVITRLKQLQIIVTCELDSNSIVEIMYVTEDEIILDNTDSGKYDVSLSFYPTEEFLNPVEESPYFIDLKEKVFLQATLQSQDSDLSAFIDTCHASPHPNFHEPTYDLIKGGCIKDDTYHNFPSGIGFARFGFSAFRFLNAHPSIYLQCKIVVCDVNDLGSRCNQGCINRHRRDLGSSVWKTNAVVGPLRLKHHTGAEAAGSVGEKAEDTKTNQSSLYVLGVAVLVVNALILAFVVLRYSRRTQYGYRYHPVATH